MGYFKINDMPIGFYQANASKRISKDQCLPTKASNYSKYPSHKAIAIFSILIIPNQTTIISFDKFISKDAMQIDLLNLPIDSEQKTKWLPQFKN